MEPPAIGQRIISQYSCWFVIPTGKERGEQRGERRGRAKAVAKIETLLYSQGYLVKDIARMPDETEEKVKDILHLL